MDSSSISTDKMEGIIAKLRYEHNRSVTREKYYNVWKNFNEFFIRLDRKPETWEDRLTLHVGYLISNKRKSSTINSYISAIKAVLMDDGQQLNEDRFLLNALTSACKLKNDKVKTRLPIKRDCCQF